MAKSKVSTPWQSSKKGDNFWFEKLASWKRDCLLIGLLYVILLVLFHEIIFKDMIFSDSGDSATAQSWVKATEHIQQEEHVEPLWIPYIFGGMPVFGAMLFPRDVNYVYSYVVQPLTRILFFNAQLHWMIGPFLLMGIAMYYFARQLKFSYGASMIAALTMMLNPYAIGLPETGHGSKLIVLSLLPLLFLSLFKLFEKRNLLWTGIVAIITGTMFLNRHPQIAFYGLLVSGLYLLYECILDIKSNPTTVVKKISLFLAALGLGFVMYAYQFLPTNDYAQYSIRGGGTQGASAASGLDYEYATNWSFHPVEIMSYVFPRFMGIVPQPESWLEAHAYWGWMPFTNSYVYMGIVPLFLGIVAIIFRRNRFTWFLIILVILFLFMSFGKHLSVLFDLMFAYMPYFNKLRVPVMILHLMPMVFGLLAAYGFNFFEEFLQQAKEPENAKLRKRLRNIVFVLGGLLIVGLVLNESVGNILSGMMFHKEGEFQQLRQQYGAQANAALDQLEKTRFDFLWKDYVKFAIFIAASLGLTILYLSRKIQRHAFAAGLALIVIVDLWILDVNYINPKPGNAIADHFQVDDTFRRLEEESAKNLFRVFPAGSLDEDNSLMYHHIQSVEGYCPAKLKIYQEVRDSCFTRGTMNVFNMLNVKYIASRQQAQDGTTQTSVQPNPGCLPRTWFVDSVVISHSKQEIFSLLNSSSWNPKTTALIEKDLPVSITASDSTTANITEFSSRGIKIEAYTSMQALLILSEVYYPAGWKAMLDGTETEIYKTNYILRSVVVPAGQHTIEFTFDPPKYALGYTLTQSSWGVTILLIIAGMLGSRRIREKIGIRKKENVPSKSESAG